MFTKFTQIFKKTPVGIAINKDKPSPLYTDEKIQDIVYDYINAASGATRLPVMVENLVFRKGLSLDQIYFAVKHLQEKDALVEVDDLCYVAMGRSETKIKVEEKIKEEIKKFDGVIKPDVPKYLYVFMYMTENPNSGFNEACEFFEDTFRPSQIRDYIRYLVSDKRWIEYDHKTKSYSFTDKAPLDEDRIAEIESNSHVLSVVPLLSEVNTPEKMTALLVTLKTSKNPKIKKALEEYEISTRDSLIMLYRAINQ